MLVTSIFSLPLSVFISFLPKSIQNLGMCSKGLNISPNHLSLVSMDGIEAEAVQSVLVLWSGPIPSEDFQQAVAELKQKVPQGWVQMEHLDRLVMGKD